MFKLKMYRGVMFDGMNIDADFEGTLTCAFKHDIRNLVNFHQSTFESLKIGTFIGSFYPL